jgi:hypothetical protein
VPEAPLKEISCWTRPVVIKGGIGGGESSHRRVGELFWLALRFLNDF